MSQDPKHRNPGSKQPRPADGESTFGSNDESSFSSTSSSPATASHAAQRATPKSERTAPTHTAGAASAKAPAKARPGARPAPGATTSPKELTEHQKQMLGSAFQDMRRINHLKSVLGTTGERKRDEDEEEETSLGRSFDGLTPAPELTARDVFKAVQAPVQSREGRRSKSLYQQVINQFAIGHNARYEPDGPQKPRGHIYVWDVSRAMNCEVPHFIGTKELNLGQTVDWLRLEGPSRGWTRGGTEDAVHAANLGQLVIAMPKEIRLKQMAVVLPLPADPDGRPRLAAAGVQLGHNLKVQEALGVFAAEFFIHT